FPREQWAGKSIDQWSARMFTIGFIHNFGLPAAAEQWIDAAAKSAATQAVPAFQEVLRIEVGRFPVLSGERGLVPLIRSAHEVAEHGLEATIRDNRRVSMALAELAKWTNAVHDSPASYGDGFALPYIPDQTFDILDIDAENSRP